MLKFHHFYTRDYTHNCGLLRGKKRTNIQKSYIHKEKYCHFTVIVMFLSTSLMSKYFSETIKCKSRLTCHTISCFYQNVVLIISRPLPFRTSGDGEPPLWCFHYLYVVLISSRFSHHECERLSGKKCGLHSYQIVQRGSMLPIRSSKCTRQVYPLKTKAKH